jgi:hypothetical protein
MARTVRDRMLDRDVATVEAITAAEGSTKAVACLSAEFLTGPHLGNADRAVQDMLRLYSMRGKRGDGFHDRVESARN